MTGIAIFSTNYPSYKYKVLNLNKNYEILYQIECFFDIVMIEYYFAIDICLAVFNIFVKLYFSS